MARTRARRAKPAASAGARRRASAKARTAAAARPAAGPVDPPRRKAAGGRAAKAGVDGSRRAQGDVPPAGAGDGAASALGPPAAVPEEVRGLHRELEALVRARFPHAEATSGWGLHGWKVRRPVTVTEWRGTMDPNWLVVLVAQRRRGVTLHLWNPYDYGFLQRHADELLEAGLKPMVGCLQFTRKAPFPLAAVDRLLARIERTMAAERRKQP